MEGVGVVQRRKVCFSFESDFRHQGSHRLSPRDVAHGKSREPRGRARARSCARSNVSECARARGRLLEAITSAVARRGQKLEPSNSFQKRLSIAFFAQQCDAM